MTIAEAAAEVLRSESRPLALELILDLIKLKNLYKFNSPDELTILREQMRRHCDLPDKKLQYGPTLFSLDEDGLFSLKATNTNRPRHMSPRRIRRASDKEEIIERLSKRSDSMFPEIWKLFVFAASVGVHAKKKEPVENYDSGKSIDFSYFSGCAAWPGLLHLIGLVENADPKVLNPDQEHMDYRVSLFEQYANAGLAILRDMSESRDYSIDAIVGMLLPLHEAAFQAIESSSAQI